MASIRVLPEQLINQIAAGEVIERPASVVKELLENAIDSQAARVTVELEQAGKKLIRVSDDGCGIPASELALALASHATSKIASAADLESITTLGFRGEALASIASVADVRLVSRTADSLEAAEVTVSGGKISAVRPASGPPGTTVEVRNLFRYVPARRKFLKTDGTEMGHITEQVARVALAYPSVHLTVTHNGRSVYELPPTDSLRGRVAAFFGADVADALVEVSAEDAAGRLRGLVGPPHLARATASMQYLFVNGRYVRDRGLLHALREAYRGLLEGGRQPVAFLFLVVPPERVDANVHPTKIEVRLRDAHLLYGQLLAAVRGRLLGPAVTPHVVQPADRRAGATEGQAEAERPGQPTAQSPDAARADRDERVRRALADFLRRPPDAAQGRLPLSGRVARSQHDPAARQAQQTEQHQPLAAAIQLHNTYLVSETADGILIVDQHALHERILFEDLVSRLSAGPLEGQRLLVPPTMHLSDREMAALAQYRDALVRLGIEVEPLGPRDVGIHSFPSLLDRADPVATVRDFLAWAIAVDAPPSPRQVLERLAHVAACRAAVKAGDPLRPEEIEALLARRSQADLAPTCPHGRPTALVLRKSDLEKQFGRDYAASGGHQPDESLPF